MRNNNLPIELKEYDTCTHIDTETLKKIEKFLKCHDIEKVLKITPTSIQSKSWVGVIKCGKTQINILPKLLAATTEENVQETILKNLTFMLSYTHQLEIRSADTALLAKSNNPFLEILIKEFATSLFDALKKQSPKSYIREEENLSYLKGKLNISGQIRHNLANQAKFYCEYDEFSENNMLNQLFYYVTVCLSNLSQNNQNKKILNQIKNFYTDIDLKIFTKEHLSKIKLNRNQTFFERPFSLAKMFIENSSVDMSCFKIENIALLWDMNKLFEEFVYEVLKKQTRNTPNNWEVVAQKGKRLLIQDTGTKRNTFVDIYATRNNETIILDTKYKKFESLDSFSNHDVFQVATYCLLHKSKKAVLIYPQWTQDKLQINACNLNTPEKDYEIQFKTVNLMQDIKTNFNAVKEEIISILPA